MKEHEDIKLSWKNMNRSDTEYLKPSFAGAVSLGVKSTHQINP
jgi:hypothetical protein